MGGTGAAGPGPGAGAGRGAAIAGGGTRPVTENSTVRTCREGSHTQRECQEMKMPIMAYMWYSAGMSLVFVQNLIWMRLFVQIGCLTCIANCCVRQEDDYLPL